MALLGEEFAKPIEAAFPGRSPPGDPVLGRPQRRRLDPAGPHPPNLPGPDKATRLEDPKVLDDRRQCHRERLGKLADRGRSTAQPLHHDPPGRVGQRLEDAIE
jgi:hypothetical protein